MRIAQEYLAQLNIEKRRWRRAAAILTVLSLMVAVGVSWNLRMTGITIANDASCGLEEHKHSEECGVELITICGFDEEEEDNFLNRLPKDPVQQEQIPQEQLPQEELIPEELPADELPADDLPTGDLPTGDLPTDEIPEEEITEEETTFEAEILEEEPAEEEITEDPVEAIFEGDLFEEEEDDALPIEPLSYFGDDLIAEEEVSDAELAVLALDLYEEEEIFGEDTYSETYQEEELEAHIHTEECYEVLYLCEMEEHLHQLTCYSDLTADLEDWSVWENSLPELTGRIADDLVAIAQSQLGMGESELNFEVAEDGETRNGITRYGQWYGNPYGPWSNMFTSFCLHYAGFEEVPANSGAAILQRKWDEAGLYNPAISYEPLAGDIVFLDKNENGLPEATGIVVEFFDGILTVIEGDVDNMVVEQQYAMDDPVILGYGITDPGSRVMMFAAKAATVEPRTIATKARYSDNLLGGGTFMVYAKGSDGKYYALDGDGNAVEVWIEGNNIISDLADTSTLYWSFESASNYDNKKAYYIRNNATGIYLHPNQDSGAAGPLHTGKWETAVYNDGEGGKLRGARQDAYVLLNNGTFTVARDRNSGSVMYFGKAPSAVTLWLDGTNGGLMAYTGSDNTKYSVVPGVGMQLPETWKSPTKYDYVLAGWVDINTGDYYQPGDIIDISENTVLYADWVAQSYDIGQYNTHVADTVSTNDFITTHMFDYSSLINLLSSKVSSTISADKHSETWSHVQGTDTVTYKDQTTLDFSFDDHDSNGHISSLNDTNAPNSYTGGTAVYQGIYNDELYDVLFETDNLFDPETGEGIIGKHYLGEGDHLFQLNEDGYYYYDAKLNAASYNQSDERFYVYEYLARTSDSAGNNDDGKYSDFLPLNSPYVNVCDKGVDTYTYNGDNGEYSGVTHYEYDARNDTSYTRANLWFGMRVDIKFGLPDDPGTRINGEYGNQDIYGNDMVFKFTGDDDVWVLVDGEVVLDLGGIHQAAEGEINFSTGKVTVEGKTTDLKGVTAGERTLTILYLERGSSMSNCAIYFNLAPRFSLDMQKEDVLTREVLKGAKFAFYYDEACTEECVLWPSREAYLEDPDSNGTNVFTIDKRGELHVWGLSPSRTYYIKEVAPPDPPGNDLPEELHYELTRGIIRLTLDKNGLYSYSATVLEEDGEISHGFTVHGFRIDEETQSAYINITNAQNWVANTTSIYVEKKWNDGQNHSGDEVIAYLNVTDPNGTVRRLREVVLSEANNWQYTWINLPKYILEEDGITESDRLVEYGVSEAYVPGYTPRVEELKNGTYTETTWADAQTMANGQWYLLKTDQGYLSSTKAEASSTSEKITLCWVSEAEAKNSPLAIWKATVSSGKIKLTNEAGQSLTYQSSLGSRQYYLSTASNDTNQNLKQTTATNGTIRLSNSSGTAYYASSLNSSGYLGANRTGNQILNFVAVQKNSKQVTVNISGLGFKITNTPLTSETSLHVVKHWDDPMNNPDAYEKAQVTMHLLANGVDTGRTETVSLKTNWMATFSGLPYYDDNGEPIVYTVKESWDNIDWKPVYGPVISTAAESYPTYSTVVTNTYRWINAVELPETGGTGILFNILCGVPLVAAPLVYGLSLRRRHGRRFKH